MKKISGKGSELVPSANRLISSLRDMGYDFSTAVCDIIDNSIEAGANRVDVDVSYGEGRPYVIISDNGSGMSKSDLMEAMRYGSARSYSEEDLGKFGLGMKTASMSQCRCFSVSSRKENSSKIHSFRWDLDHIVKTNRWEVLIPDDKKTLDILNGPIKKRHGTVVLWERMDRVLGHGIQDTEQVKRKLNSLCRELEKNLSMVFHKFIDDRVPRNSLKIYINGNKIDPWDPFVRKNPKTKELSTSEIFIEKNGRKYPIKIRPYILPSKIEFASNEAFDKAGGPEGWNHQQGFYIYRSNRMIQSGGWSGLRARDEHTKLARIEISFSPKLDDEFKINVAKMRVQLPSNVKENLGSLIKPIVKLARERYDHKMRSVMYTTRGHNGQIEVIIPKNTGSTDRGVILSEDGVFTVKEFEKILINIASKREREILKKLFRKLKTSMI